jgi:hypothetical protein
LMALDIWGLCNLLCNLEVKLFHTILDGGSFKLR